MAARGDRAQVLFLGTGSAEPSKYRGSAGVQVRLSGGRGLLLDAGEGAWGALLRHYGPAQARAEVRLLQLEVCSTELSKPLQRCFRCSGCRGHFRLAGVHMH